MKCLIRVPTVDVEDQLVFYRAVGFVVSDDVVDGRGIRCVTLVHPEIDGALFNLSPVAETPVATDERILFGLVVDWGTDLPDRLIDAGFEERDASEAPYGFWKYFRDPAGNRILITNMERW